MIYRIVRTCILVAVAYAAITPSTSKTDSLRALHKIKVASSRQAEININNLRLLKDWTN